MKIVKGLTPVDSSKAVPTTQNAVVRKIYNVNSAGKANKLHITASAAQLRELESQLGRLETTDDSKVKSVRLAINTGCFKVDSEVVADKVIESAKETIRKPPVSARPTVKSVKSAS